MNQSSKFINFDRESIELCKFDHKYNFKKIKTILEDNNEGIEELVISQKDDLIVNSMLNGTLLFWKKNIDWKCYQKLKVGWGEQDYLTYLTLNQKGDILIATNYKELFLFSYNPNHKQNAWQLKETIKKKYQAHCFLNEANFACISDLNVITIYKVSSELRQLQKINLSEKKKSNHWAIIEYSKLKSLLLVQFYNKLYLIGKNSGEYIEQKIYHVQGDMTFSKNQDFLLLFFRDGRSKISKIELRRVLAID